jgi:hypothetical protein
MKNKKTVILKPRASGKSETCVLDNLKILDVNFFITKKGWTKINTQLIYGQLIKLSIQDSLKKISAKAY